MQASAYKRARPFILADVPAGIARSRLHGPFLCPSVRPSVHPSIHPCLTAAYPPALNDKLVEDMIGSYFIQKLISFSCKNYERQYCGPSEPMRVREAPRISFSFAGRQRSIHATSAGRRLVHLLPKQLFLDHGPSSSDGHHPACDARHLVHRRCYDDVMNPPTANLHRNRARRYEGLHLPHRGGPTICSTAAS